MSAWRLQRPLTLLATLLFCLCASAGLANPPRLYHQGAYQSPVRADPDDLLALVGDGLDAEDLVVYQAYGENDRPGDHPDRIPAQSTAEVGIAKIVSTATPYQLTIRLPDALIARRAYHLWVRNANGEWSNAVSINDARPLWFSPSEVYSTQSMAGLPRYVKVIGRNLSPPDPIPLQVRLEGPRLYELTDDLGGIEPALRRYVAVRPLPALLVPGNYQVEVRVGAAAWMAVPGQVLAVLPDPPETREFDVSDDAYGHCRPNDDQDDTPCAAKAIDAARLAGGGTVVFGRGTWDLRAGVLAVPPFVDLQGRGADATRIVRHDQPSAPAYISLFDLLGHNRVRDLTFADATTFTGIDSMHPILQLGTRYATDLHPSSIPSAVSTVEISGNIFDKTHGAIVAGGSPIDHLLIAHNQFGDYALALDLRGNRYNVRSPLRIDDSVIASNRFMPGSYIDLKGHQGVIASEMGASTRVDFSSNVADGADRHYLNSPTDPPGWRAAFFWSMNNNDEMLLISANTISCSGDKAGDGEAISMDTNANTFAFRESQPVIEATSDTVRVAGPLMATQNNRAVDVRSYYVGHWLRIDSGPGTGQARKILSYRIDPGGVTFSVDPAWDVVPEPSASHVTVGREYWQTFIVGNMIDQRRPLCTKNNGNSPKGGGIVVWMQNTDSVVEANKQYDTDGIVFVQRYIAAERSCATCTEDTIIPSFLDIRGNLIDGEYDWDSACSVSGIMGTYGASPTPRSPPPLLDVAVSISHNRIIHADALDGGAIDIVPSWYQGPAGYARPLVSGLMIDHNDISRISGPPPRSACNYRQDDRIGIHLQGYQGHKNVDATVLYMNRCEDVKSRVADHAAHTIPLCDQSENDSCECATAK